MNESNHTTIVRRAIESRFDPVDVGVIVETLNGWIDFNLPRVLQFAFPMSPGVVLVGDRRRGGKSDEC